MRSSVACACACACICALQPAGGATTLVTRRAASARHVVRAPRAERTSATYRLASRDNAWAHLNGVCVFVCVCVRFHCCRRATLLSTSANEYPLGARDIDSSSGSDSGRDGNAGNSTARRPRQRRAVLCLHTSEPAHTVAWARQGHRATFNSRYVQHAAAAAACAA